MSMRFFIILFAFFCTTSFGFVNSVNAITVGTLVKGESFSSVYYVASDGKRYVFPNEHIYFSWYKDFSTVKVISDSALAKYTIGGNIAYRAGARLIKIANDPKVYAVEPGGILRWIKTESIAQALYGNTWAKRVDDMSDSFFSAYSIGEPLESGIFPEGWIAKDSTGGQIIAYMSGVFKPFTEEGIQNNRFSLDNQLSYDFSGKNLGTAISAVVGFYADASQDGYGKRLPTDVVVSNEISLLPIFQGENTQQVGGLFISTAKTVILKSMTFTLKAGTNSDADTDAGGLVYGDNSENINANLVNIRLINDQGLQVLGASSLNIEKAGDGGQRLVVTGKHTLLPGKTHLRLVADVYSLTPIHEKYYVSWDIASSIFELETGELASKTPLSLDGSEVEVSAGGLEIKLASGIGQDIQVAQKTSLFLPKIGGFSFYNPTSESIYIDDLKFGGYIDEGEGNDDFQLGYDSDRLGGGHFVSEILDNITLSDSTNAVLQESLIGSDGAVWFRSLGLSILPRSSVVLYIGGNIKLNAPYDIYPDRISFDVVDPKNDVNAHKINNVEVDVFGTKPNGGSSPTQFTKIAKHGELTIKGSGSGGSRLIMGQSRQNTYTLKLSADDIEDMQVNKLSLRLQDTVSVRDIDSVELRYSINGGATIYDKVFVDFGAVTFSPLSLIIPKNKEVEVSVQVNLKTSAEGAFSGDRIGWIFEQSTFEVTGVSSHKKLDESDFDEFLFNETVTGGNTIVSQAVPVVRVSQEAPEITQSKDQQAEMYAFELSSLGSDGAKITKLTFKIEPSDVGYDLNSVEANNDLLEYLDDLPLVGLDANGVSDIIDENGDIIGDGSDASLRFSIYDESLRSRIESPTNIDSNRGDYGLITYTFRDPIILSSIPQRFRLAIDTRGLAVGSRTLKVTLLGSDDFAWNDGSLLAYPESGDGVNQLPAIGPTITLK